MSVAERTRDLIQAITDSYTSQVKYSSNKEINSWTIMNQLMTVTCGTGGSECKDCLGMFFAPEALVGENYIRNEEAIDKVRDGVCAGVCLCSVTASQEMSVNFLTGVTITHPSSTQMNAIFTEVISKLGEKYGSTFRPSKQDIINIVEGGYIGNDGSSVVSIGVDLNSVVNQTIAATQWIDIKGVGKITNVRMQVMIDAVFNAIVNNSISIVNRAVQDSVDMIKKNVDTKIKQTWGDVFANFKWYWIGVGAAIVFTFILYIAVFLYKKFR